MAHTRIIRFVVLSALASLMLIIAPNFVKDSAQESGTFTYIPQPPYVINLQGEKVSEINAGQQVMIMHTFSHYKQEPTHFLAIIDVRDTKDVTQFLAWQSGTMNANEEYTIGLSWSVENTGTYQIRGFAVTGLENAQIISPIAHSEIIVS